ncbi:MAG: prolipoprotein diacylglyceryl transferase [Thermoanaerobaculia bacterium]
MIQELFHIGPVSISPFGVTMMLAFLAGYWQLSRGLSRTGAGDADDAWAITLAAGIGGILGAKIYYAVLYQDWRLLLSRSGLVWYGGLLLGAALVLWVVRRRRLAMAGTLDATALALALGYAIGRVGCFLVGDDYGVPSDLPWAVAFPVGLPTTTAWNLQEAFGVAIPSGVAPDELLRVHPTQLYETLLALMIWGVGLLLLRRGARGGAVALTTVLLLALERFGIEFLRAKDDRFIGDLTLAQGISLGVLLVAGGLAVWRWRGGSPAAEVGRRVGEPGRGRA